MSPFEDLDETSVRGEKGELYLFQWLSSLEKHCSAAALDDIKARQSDLERNLVKVVLAPDPFPPPGRALRNLAARCLVVVYTRGETRSLFDTLQVLLKIVGDFKVLDKEVNKIAAFSCIGELMAAFGTQFMSFMAEITAIALKTVKSSNSSLLRYHALVALRKSLTTAKRALPDGVHRDVLKQMKSGINDKSLSVQRAVADVLLVMHSSIDYTMAVADIESIIALCSKSLETADQITRHSHSQLVGQLLASTQAERPLSAPESSQKGKQDSDDNDESLAPHAGFENSKTMLTMGEMFALLSSQFNKMHVSRRVRVGIFDFYAALLSKLGSTVVESNYASIVSHLMADIVSNPRNNATRYETLLTRHLVGIILRDLIGVRMLSEQGQIGAIQELSRSYLKRWPAMMPGQVPPCPSVLVIALREVAGLMKQLGNAPPPVQDAVADPLVTLLAHQMHTVRVTASWALRCFCNSTPSRLPKTVLTVLEMLQRDLSSLLIPAVTLELPSRALGHAYGLAALISVIPERPLYVSYDVSAKVLDMAIHLLKRAGDHDVKIAGVEIEVAWTSIASLMSLGPNFVRPHLPQLLVLWRNALPKPTSKESSTNDTRSIGEWAFLLHVRECALSAILCFLKHNSSALVTLDVARRVASMLSNALSFANSLIAQRVDDITESTLLVPSNGLPLRSREALLRRRVYECFTALGFSSITDSTQSTLLHSAISLFASPDGYAGSAVQAAIASSSGAFISVWQSVDGYAYGVTYLDIFDNVSFGLEDDPSVSETDRLNRDTIEVSIDVLLHKPVLGAIEHDPLSLCQAYVSQTDSPLREPPPAATSVVDAAIELFAQLLPLQDLACTTRIITQLLESVRSPKLEKNSGRKGAVLINATIALLLTMRHASASHLRRARDTFGNSQVTAMISSFWKDTLLDGDPILRSASSETIGRITSLAGTAFLTNQIKLLVDQVVNNRDPNGRAGCALAFGAIYTHVGGLVAGPLLKTTVTVLMSLSNDPHPLVHYWALNALSRVINSASLAYAPFVSSTLGMLLKVYLLESHEREGGTLSNANMSGDYPAYPVLCQIIDAVITILGPDIQESPRTRSLVLNLVHEFTVEEDEAISVEAFKCIQHFLMFAPEHVHIPELVERFRCHLSSPRRPLKLASINALYQLVQKDALAISKLGGDRLVEDLFRMLDDDSSVEGVKSLISSWLQQTSIHNPSAWIDLCQRIMARTTASQRVAEAATTQGGLRDDEGDSLNLGMTDRTGTGKAHLTSRWRTQLFALHCLHNICIIVAQSGRKEHIDVTIARSMRLPTSGLLVSRVPDLIKMAFTASTAYVSEIRLEGLVVLRDVIEIFSSAPDPDYSDALLLEQHQAPITAALTPAFSPDSTPEILASAIKTSAIFVGCGVVKDTNRMGRILRLLTGALNQSKGRLLDRDFLGMELIQHQDSGMISLGDAGELGPNASAMLRISTLSAWAQLEIASSTQIYLVDIIKPYRLTLAQLWIASLRDYACIRANSEFLHDTSSVSLDSSYSSLGREVLLPYYVDSWPVILQAVARAMQIDDPYISAAMDSRASPTNGLKGAHSDEPATFFFVLFGLVFESLATSSTDSTLSTSTRQATVIAALQALKSLVRPEYAGKAMLDSTIFNEFMNLCYRLAMTETASIQIHLVEMLTTLSACHGYSLNPPPPLTSVQDHCLRICAYILRHVVPNSQGAIIEGKSTDKVDMVIASFSAFRNAALAATDLSTREDIRSIAILLYCDLLKDEHSEVDFVGPTLLSLKSILEIPTSPISDALDRFTRSIHGLLSACLLNIDEMRGRQGENATRKVKSNLLTSVLVLTIIPPAVKVGRMVIEYCCFLICQKLIENGEVSLTAAYCAKTLLLATTSRNATFAPCPRILVPGLIEYTAIVTPSLQKGVGSEQYSLAMAEIWKGFSAFVSSVEVNQRARVLNILVPMIGLLLRCSQAHAMAVKSQIVAQLLSFATTSPLQFKEAAGRLDPITKDLVEQSLKSAAGMLGGQTISKPSISLRSF